MSPRFNAVPKLPQAAVILAGGRGTRFWPRSRMRTPKQLLNIVGAETMLEQTAARLAPIFAWADLWVVTNGQQAREVRRQLPHLSRGQVLAEPVGRNTAPAIGLAAIHLAKRTGDALMAVLPADHYIAQPGRYRAIVRAALQVASEPGALCVLGIPPVYPETGFGYIESQRPTSPERAAARAAALVLPVRRFTEKPALKLARRYVASGRYFWNAGMFFWRVSSFLENLRKFLPHTYELLQQLAATIGTSRYARALASIYPRLENISVDYAILEPATRQAAPPHVYVLPAEVGWSDMGSWAAVYEWLAHPGGGRRTSASRAKRTDGQREPNVVSGPYYALDAHGNFLWIPDKFVAAIGVRDLIVVETPDAIFICPRQRAQDAGQVVKWLEAHDRRSLL
jgi:mannose-1-phosphate guanylyltransferase